MRSPSAGLHATVVDTHLHVVTEQTDTDYPRRTLGELRALPEERTWRPVAWRRDVVATSIVLWADDDLPAVAAEASMTGPDGHALPVRLDFVAEVLAARGNPSLGNPRSPVPDVLDGTAPRPLPRDHALTLRAAVEVPSDAAPGRSGGRITVRAGDEEVVIAVELEVLDLALPERPTPWLDLWQNPFAIARVHRIGADRLWSDEHLAAMRPYYALLAAAGQRVITTTVTRDPWASQTEDVYESMVEWRRGADGAFTFGFGVFDTWVSFLAELGIDAQIDAYGMVGWANTVTWLDEASGRTETVAVEPGSAPWRALWGPFLAAFVAHLDERGWLARTTMALDERTLADVLAVADFVAERSGGRLGVSAATDYNSMTDPALDRVRAVSVRHDTVSMSDDVLTEIARHRAERGLVTTLYTCTGNFPNSFTRSSPAEGVWMGWKVERFGVSGLLRWAYDSFNADPLATTDFRSWESGDTFLVYPGPRSSVRFEALREGLRDADRIRVLRADPAAGAEIDVLLATMRDEGVGYDPLGGVIDPRVIDLPAEVARLQQGLLRIARAHLARRGGAALDRP